MRPAIDEIEHLDAYLRIALRNLFVSQQRRRAVLERSRLTFEHRPTRLYVYANGFQVVSQVVSGSTTSATVTVTLSEPLRSVELCSEQGLCLAYVDVNSAHEGALDQQCHVDLQEIYRQVLLGK